MIASVFDATRLLDIAGIVVPRSPLSLVARRPIVAGSRAITRLVDALLATEDNPAVYPDLLAQVDAVHRLIDRMPEGAPETKHLEQVLDAVPLCGEMPLQLREHLAIYGTYLEGEARLDEALDILTLGARTYGLALPLVAFAERALQAGRLNAMLARWDCATSCYGAAAEAAQLAGRPAIALRSRLGHGAIYRLQGRVLAARAVTESVLRESVRLGLSEVQVLAHWELGTVLRLEGVVAEGLQAVYDALQLITDADDRHRAFYDVGIGLAAVGAYDESANVFEAILTDRYDRCLQMRALIGLMGTSAATANRIAFERWRDEAEAVRVCMPPVIAVEHRYALGTGLACFGQHHRAHLVLSEALSLAEAHELSGWSQLIEFQRQPMAKAG